MKERPILFSGPMVRAILDGKKTQTRRIMRVPDPGSDVERVEVREGAAFFLPSYGPNGSRSARCPYGVAGDRLWVRETWYDDLDRGPCEAEQDSQRLEDGRVDGIEYRASHDCTSFEAGCPCNPDGDGKRSEWRPSIFMPRWASRITLEVTGVRVERLQDIGNEDARAEGVDTSLPARINGELGTVHNFGPQAHRQAFAQLWDGINGKRASWASNPWVWVVSFRRIEATS